MVYPQIQSNVSPTFQSLDSANAFAFTLYSTDPMTMLSIGIKSLSEAKEFAYPSGVANSYNTIGLAHLSLGNYDRSSTNFIEALRNYESLNDSINALKIKSNLGVVLYYLNEFEKSLKYHQEVYDEALKKNDSTLLARSLNNIGIAYKSLEDYEKALDAYNKCLLIKMGLGDSTGVSTTLNNIGNVFLKQGLYKKAIEFFEESKLIDSVSGQYLGVAKSNINIALSNIYLKKYSVARKLLNSGLNEALKLGSISTELLARKHLYDLYKALNDDSNALKELEKLRILEDSIKIQETSRRLSELEVKYENEKIISENTLLRQNSLLQEEKILRNSLVTWSLVIGVLFLILVLTFYYRSFLLKKRLLAVERELSLNKDNVLATVVHDLRNPIYNIKSMLEFIRNSVSNLSLEEKKMMKGLDEASQGALDLISELLDVSELEGRGYELEMEALHINEYLKELIDPHIVKFNYEGISLEYEFDEENPLVGINRNKFSRVINNLIDNAKKFTPSEGKIMIRTIKRENGGAKISIEDTGIGISNKMQNVLFEKFSKAGRIGLKGEKSTGLGLHIVKQITELHNGTISVQSELEKGTRFEINLPPL